MIAHLFTHGSGKTTRGQAILLGSLLLLLSVALWGFMLWEWRQAIRDQRRIAVPCQITQSEVTIDHKQGKRRENPYAFAVAYRFTLGGSERFGHGYDDAKNHTTDDAAEAFGLARKYPPGAAATCYVDPDDGSDTRLVPRKRSTYDCSFIAVSVALYLVIRYAVIPMFRYRPTNEEDAGKKERRERIMVAIFQLLMTVATAWLLVIPVINALRARGWTPTPCEIVSSELISRMVSGGEVHFTGYHPDVCFKYEIAGVTYHSNAFNFTDFMTPMESGKRALIERFPVGASARCYVNPRDPAQAVLTRDVRPTLAFGLTPLILGGFVTLGMAHERRIKRAAQLSHEMESDRRSQRLHRGAGVD